MGAGKAVRHAQSPAFGLAGVNNHTWTGAWGTVSYWNAYVGNLEMHGKGVFYDPRLDDAEKYPVAARTKEGYKQDKEDQITAKLSALHFCQLSLPTPATPQGSFDSAAAEADEIGIDDFQAMRSPEERYRTASLRALWNTEKIPYGRILP